MRAFHLPSVLVAAVLLGACANAWPLGLRCGARIVAPGMLATQVLAACGTPFWTDSYSTLEVLGAGGPVERQREVNWDVWYYNFGPSRLMQMLSFRDGELQAVAALGYGFAQIGSACVAPAAARGLASGELLARCGEPTLRRHDGGAIVRRAPGAVFLGEERREQWIYDDGSGYFTRFQILSGTVTGADRLPQ